MAISKPTPQQLTDATKAVLHLRNRLAIFPLSSMFESLSLNDEMRECLSALAEVGAFYIEHRERMSMAGKKGGSARSEKKTQAVRANSKKPRERKAKVLA